MELWIPLTIAAAFFQNIRSALQKHLQGRLSTLGAAYVRFVYALPVAFVYLVGLYIYSGGNLPDISTEFLLYSMAGGLCQILFTVFLLWLFSFHNFAVGTTFSKLETVMVAIFGLLLLGDELTRTIIFAIALSSVGLIILSAAQSHLTLNTLLSGLWQKSTLIGLSCAAWLGASVVFFRAASLSLQLDDYLLSASFTLFIVLFLQTVIMGMWMFSRDRGNFAKVFIHWRPAAAVGLSGGLTSIGWFTAFTLQNATYVRALGQIELLFTFVATVFFFREKITRGEFTGISFITLSIIFVLLG
ncbi:MAG: EamA family transporter [Gammaproteobacteria bacterium]|nr:EamA family transporter [Gammaproteobacteria bacterium]